MGKTKDLYMDMENARNQARRILEEMLDNNDPEYVWELMQKLQDQEE